MKNCYLWRYIFNFLMKIDMRTNKIYNQFLI